MSQIFADTFYFLALCNSKIPHIPVRWQLQ